MTTAEKFIDVHCTGCTYRTDVWSGLFDPRKAGHVEHTFVRDPACPIHGTSPDPRIAEAAGQAVRT